MHITTVLVSALLIVVNVTILIRWRRNPPAKRARSYAAALGTGWTVLTLAWVATILQDVLTHS